MSIEALWFDFFISRERVAVHEVARITPEQVRGLKIMSENMPSFNGRPGTGIFAKPAPESFTQRIARERGVTNATRRTREAK